jgi:SEC-C motif-containing protein
VNHPYTREQIENWAGDYCAGDAIRPFPAPLREFAHEVLVRLLAGACEARDIGLQEIGEPDLRRALLSEVALLDLPAQLREEVPALCGSFLAELEREGRLGDGRALGAFVRALKPAFLEATGKAVPYQKPGTPVSRNDPCPCGSGKKYKKCCQRLLDR